MKLIIVCTLLLFSTVCAEWDLSKVKPIVPPGFESVGSKVDPRITNGEVAVPNSFPHQVGLFIGGDEYSFPGFCGGSLISPMHVMTAAHCAVISDRIVAVMGAHWIKNASEVTQLAINVTQRFIHKDYNPKKLFNDIAILKLLTAVELSANIQVVLLPRHSQKKLSFSGAVATASGWGRESDKSTTISDVLRYVISRVITNLECSLRYGPLISVKDTHICTDSNILTGKSTCNGDSGGPLTIQDPRGTIQIGIVSFGIAAGCELGWPPAFTRVSRFLDWIEQNCEGQVVIAK